MEFYIFVIILIINLNHCEPINQTNHDDPKQQTTFSSNKSSNNSETERVEVMEAPEKSENDKKLYRVIRLQNGLTALLISTEQENGNTKIGIDRDNKSGRNVTHQRKVAACSLRVDVGSFSDPRDVQGLAHFVEHMLLKASEKYPNEDEFGKFMHKTGGRVSAHTDLDDTTYNFQAYEEFLDAALDQFAEFFIAPLMPKETMIRERESIESEFALASNDDDARRAQLLASFGQITHPASKLPHGNLKTLKENISDDELYRRTHEFRERHYSAHRMYVSLQSDQSLNNLLEMVVRHFSAIPNNSMPGIDFSAFTHLNAFQPKFHEKVFYVKSVGSSGSKLDIAWCLEPIKKNFKSKNFVTAGILLAHEGKGSLLAYLRKKLWATDLTALFHKSAIGCNSLFSLAAISIDLTDRGFDYLDDVLAAIFSYLKFLKHAQLDASYFHEYRQAKLNVNRYALEPNAFDNVQSLTKNMLLYPSKYFVTASDHSYDYDMAGVRKIIDHLNTRKMNIMITSMRSKSQQIKYESREPWFGTMYTEMDMPTRWIMCHELQQTADPFPEFTLPQPNPFITDDFTILNDGDLDPTTIFENEFSSLVYQKNSKWRRPYADVSFFFTKARARTSIDNEIQMALLSLMLNYQLAEELTQAKLVGIEYSCRQYQSGIAFIVQGFNQKMDLVVDIFAKSLKSVSDGPSREQFDMFVQQQFEIYEKEMLNPEQVAEELLATVTDSHHHPPWEKHKHLRSISFSDFQQFCRSFCEQMDVSAQMHGNIKEDHALVIMENLLNNFQCKQFQIPNSNRMRPKLIPIGKPHHYLRVKNFNANSPNSAIMNYYQIGSLMRDDRMLLELLDLIIQGSALDILRYEEQLAYGIVARMYFDRFVPGYYIIVNSQETKYDGYYVDQRIEEFHNDLFYIIQQMRPTDFDTLKKSLAKAKWIEYDQLFTNGLSMCSENHALQRVEYEVECIMWITKENLLKFYRDHFEPKHQRKLSIHVIGNAQAAKNDTNANDSTESFDTLAYAATKIQVSDIVRFGLEKMMEFQVQDLMTFRDNLKSYDIV